MQTTTSNGKTTPTTSSSFSHDKTRKLLTNLSASPPNDLWEEVISRWSYDLYSRRPAPPKVLRDNAGNLLGIQSTDLDLAALLSALAERKAVVQIPHYTSRRAGKSSSNTVNLSPDYRRGKIIGLTSHQDLFSFGLRIEDMSVMQASVDGGRLGAPRNFMIVDVDGDFYEGWDQIDFLSTEKENAFINDFQLAMGGDLIFGNFVHPNRWTSFYGEDYLLAKIAIERAERETTFLRQQLKALAQFAPAKDPASYRGPVSLAGNPKTKDDRPTTTVTVTAFNAEVDVNSWNGDFVPYLQHSDGYLAAKAQETFLQYHVLPRLRFAARATELAFHLHTKKCGHTLPSWIKTSGVWEGGYRLPKGRTEWMKFDFNDVFLRYRTWQKTEKVVTRTED